MASSRAKSATITARTLPGLLRRLWFRIDVQSVASLMVVATIVGLGTG